MTLTIAGLIDEFKLISHSGSALAGSIPIKYTSPVPEPSTYGMAILALW